MKIRAIVSEVQRDVGEMLKAREENNGKSEAVRNPTSLWYSWMNNSRLDIGI